MTEYNLIEHKPRILMVDDLPENLYALELILREFDYDLDKAHSGEEALKKSLKNEYSLFLLDVQMPGMDGFEVAELLKNNNKTKMVPIIFITAMLKDEHSIKKGFESGAVDYISKPVDEFLLKLKIKMLLQLHFQNKELEMTRQRLVQMNQNLENLVAERTVELTKTNDELVKEITVRKQAQRKLFHAQESERKRIGHEIHDGLGQLLIAMKFGLGSMEDLPEDQLKPQLTNIEDTLSETIEESRRIIRNLSTRVLEEEGLEKAIEEMCLRLFKTSSTKVASKVKIQDSSVDKNVLATIYRITQEAINNIVKYSEAAKVIIEISQNRDNIEILIKDNGKGFDMQSSDFKTGNGLTNMKERAKAFNGLLQLSSAPGNGTTIIGKIPVK